MSAVRASILMAVVTAQIAAVGSWPVGCASTPRVMELQPLRVERQWRRSVGVPQLELPAPRIVSGGDGVIVGFLPSATIDSSIISRTFLVSPTATILGAAPRGETVVDLEAAAAEMIRDNYPALATNAEAVVAPAQIEMGEAVVATGRGRSLAKLRMSIDPMQAQVGQPKPVLLAARSVAISASRLVSREDPSVTLIEGRRIEGSGDEQRFEFAFSGLGEGDCRRLRKLFLGEYAIVVDCEVRTGSSNVALETRTFPASGASEWQDSIRQEARKQLEAIAVTDPATALSMELIGETGFARRGETLPVVSVTNVSDRPVLDLRTFTVAYQIREGTALAYVGNGVADGEPCLCPGETLEIRGLDRLDPCGEAIADAGDGLLAAVSTTAIDSRMIGPIPVEAAPRFGARLLPPRVEGAEVLLEATAVSAVPQGAVEVRLLFGEVGEIRSAFPAIPEGGAGVLRLPGDLDAEAATLWAEWREAGGRVDVELLEASLWECEDALPARQAFRIGR